MFLTRKMGALMLLVTVYTVVDHEGYKRRLVTFKWETRPFPWKLLNTVKEHLCLWTWGEISWECKVCQSVSFHNKQLQGLCPNAVRENRNGSNQWNYRRNWTSGDMGFRSRYLSGFPMAGSPRLHGCNFRTGEKKIQTNEIVFDFTCDCWSAVNSQ